jgi:hypothetical protein
MDNVSARQKAFKQRSKMIKSKRTKRGTGFPMPRLFSFI